MEILTFEVRGKMAHFRKYYANNTAFSFSIPPRTTLMGMVAAAMGWQKDDYYDKLSTKKIRFAIRVLEPMKKSFHRLNFIRIDDNIGDFSKSMSSDFRGHSGKPIQTPFEVITPIDLRTGDVAYQVFLAAGESGTGTFDEIAQHFTNHPPVYNLSLGTANFQANLTNIQLLKAAQIVEQQAEGFLLLHSAVPSKMVEELSFEKDQLDRYNSVEEELLPGEFYSDPKRMRELKSMNRLLFSISQHPIRVRLNASFWEVHTERESLNIQFMDV
jgi:CRISPR-associated protein Cas5h